MSGKMWRWLGVWAVLGWATAAQAEDLFTYWTELQAVNLTPYDIKITKVNWKYLDKDSAHIKVGHVIPKADPNSPEQQPTMIGKVSRWSGGVDMEIWFQLLGNRCLPSLAYRRGSRGGEVFECIPIRSGHRVRRRKEARSARSAMASNTREGVRKAHPPGPSGFSGCQVPGAVGQGLWSRRES